jgi:hypothetical protein
VGSGAATVQSTKRLGRVARVGPINPPSPTTPRARKVAPPKRSPRQRPAGLGVGGDSSGQVLELEAGEQDDENERGDPQALAGSEESVDERVGARHHEGDAEGDASDGDETSI